jgi:hypothetical protein
MKKTKLIFPDGDITEINGRFKATISDISYPDEPLKWIDEEEKNNG